MFEWDGLYKREGFFSTLKEGEVPERSKGTDCKSVAVGFGGSNPPLPTIGVDGHAINLWLKKELGLYLGFIAHVERWARTGFI